MLTPCRIPSHRRLDLPSPLLPAFITCLGCCPLMSRIIYRRSRTSGSVLQTALCYLEAIRPKVPELILKEQSGQGSSAEFDSEFKAL
ncbi:hypothetical protein R3P38DRAFT_2655403, partial [Favolaschia claudopus]